MREVVALLAVFMLLPGANPARAASPRTAHLAERGKAAANSLFRQPLGKQEKLRHALGRLTFGPRPGDLAELQKTGLKRWLDAELHPERVPEDPALAGRLAPLATIGMSARETYLQYPPPAAIAAAARGRGNLPDDPALRNNILRLASQYLRKRPASQTETVTPDDFADLAPARPLTDFVTAEQADMLAHGSAEQRRVVLAAIPPAHGSDFAWALEPRQRRELVPLAPVALRRDLLATLNPQRVVTSDLSEAKVLRAVYGRRQLEELLVDFWFNHFNVSMNKGGDHYLTPSYEREAIRPHVFGRFYDLLLATAQSPAMLFYLDNWQSVAPLSSGQQSVTRGRKAQRGLNENYGRELLELHTLGVNGGYTQQDVTEVARCFTGWTIAQPRQRGGFEYNDRVHDKGQKIVLGHVIPAGGGMSDGLAVLDLLAHSPSTAHFLSLKLAERFVADDPPPSLVDRMARNFLKTGGDLRELTKTMITSPEFWSRGAYQAKVKTPFEMVVSAVRATNAETTSAFALANEIEKLGEPLYRKTEPTGYSSANAEWVSAGSLLERMNFALALAHNRVAGVHVDTDLWSSLSKSDPLAVARLILNGDPSAATEAAIQKTLASRALEEQLASGARAGPPQAPSLIAGLSLGAPEFQHR